jgi:hypothetical protein
MNSSINIKHGPVQKTTGESTQVQASHRALPPGTARALPLLGEDLAL